MISAVHGFAGPGRPSPEAIDRGANRALIQAAAGAGVRHLVLVSVLGAAPDHPMSLHRAKDATEQALKTSCLPWTIIRLAGYLETWIAVIGAKLAGDGQALVLGPGRNPINFVSARDVAAIVDLAAHDQSLRGQLVEVAGPENLTFTQLAHRLITASGKPGRNMFLALRCQAPTGPGHASSSSALDLVWTPRVGEGGIRLAFPTPWPRPTPTVSCGSWCDLRRAPAVDAAPP